MSPAIPFRRRSSLPSLLIVLGAVAAAVIGFAVTMTFLNWQSRLGAEQTRVEILRPTPAQSGQIEVIDGDTVRFKGVAYRLVGIDTPERGDKAPCE
jgi:endonuclease YncB( thermonuclease family)